MDKPSICVLINIFTRPDNAEVLIKAFLGQSLKPSRIHLYIDYNLSHDFEYYLELIKKVRILQVESRSEMHELSISYSTSNTGVWGRFIYAANFHEEYLMVTDDDTVPGRDWLLSCYQTSAMYDCACTTYGLRFAANTSEYFSHESFGWVRPSTLPASVDFMGQNWFIKREWLSQMSYYGLNLLYPRSGEDLFISFYITRILGKTIIVPPHPRTDVEQWGSIRGVEEGCDINAISMQNNAKDIFRMQFINYRWMGGYCINDDNEEYGSESGEHLSNRLLLASSAIANTLERSSIKTGISTAQPIPNEFDIINEHERSIKFIGQIIGLKISSNIAKQSLPYLCASLLARCLR